MIPWIYSKVAFLYVFAEVNAKTIRRMMHAPADLHLTNWTQFCRDALSKDLIVMQNVKIGGPGTVVVVDETALAKRKND